MLFGDNKRPLFSKGEHWTGAVMLHPGATIWTVPSRVIAVQVFAFGGGGAGGGTLRGSKNPKSAGGGGGGGGLSIKTFRVTPGTNINLSIGSGGSRNFGNDGDNGGATTVTYALVGISLVADGGKGGTTTSKGGAPGGNGGTASGGDINVVGGKGGTGNATNGRGGGGASANNADGGHAGLNSGYVGACMDPNIDQFVFAMSLVPASTSFCGSDGVAGANGTPGDQASGGGGGGRTSSDFHAGGRGGNGFVVIMYLEKK